MRWFWGILIVLAAVAAVLLLVPSGSKPIPAPTPAAPAPARVDPPAAAPAPTTIPEPSAPSAPQPAKPPVPGAAPVAAPAPAPSAPEGVRPIPPEPAPAGVSPRPVDPAASAPRPSVETPVAPRPADPAPVPDGESPAASPPASDRGSRGWSVSGFVGPLRPGEYEAMMLKGGVDAALGLSDGEPMAAQQPVPETGPGAGGGGSDPSAKAKLTPRDDGSVLVDDRFVLKGKGTKDDPYVVSWEMLVSAQDTYQPRLGRKIIPDRLKMLDGKWVRIAGYIAFPLMAQSQDEMLMMLNQWDGCCIGVPPTPYDAIEVKLKTAAKGEDRLRVSGGITGILRVDPYLVKDWLVSLYLMDDAELAIDANAVRRPENPEGHVPQQ